jgi:hypothetical protein
MIDGIVVKGILKYRSMIARISVAYAELAPDVKMTLQVSSWLLRGRSNSSPDQNSLLDTEFPGIKLEAE